MPKRKNVTPEALENKRARLGAAAKSLEEYSLKPNTLRERERTAAMDEEKRAQDRHRKARNESFARFKKAQIKQSSEFSELSRDRQAALVEEWRSMHTAEYDRKAAKKQAETDPALSPDEQAEIDEADWFLELGDSESKSKITFQKEDQVEWEWDTLTLGERCDKALGGLGNECLPQETILNPLSSKEIDKETANSVGTFAFQAASSTFATAHNQWHRSIRKFWNKLVALESLVLPDEAAMKQISQIVDSETKKICVREVRLPLPHEIFSPIERAVCRSILAWDVAAQRAYSSGLPGPSWLIPENYNYSANGFLPSVSLKGEKHLAKMAYKLCERENTLSREQTLWPEIMAALIECNVKEYNGITLEAFLLPLLREDELCLASSGIEKEPRLFQEDEEG
ncbi:uncharacterized protein SEPMUDRAFT_121751 [Sphaerulina musiva SO2202]|uniref:Uncharacterized protein n=1 Tax=Sphaerulina musiva (strain SO2202) TaxID=692275 RepID=M3CW52_SPHMS|nr:uncharacterized protein SEPMUDRAFT_121751 [Sphaerulina musiva SO2202]EMF07901.1 hypothetical protein SEPMUDRAFT_121751 [Sphaerulina musiva SO2202]